MPEGNEHIVTVKVENTRSLCYKLIGLFSYFLITFREKKEIWEKEVEEGKLVQWVPQGHQEKWVTSDYRDGW